jgi:hypothetical protein
MTCGGRKRSPRETPNAGHCLANNDLDGPRIRQITAFAMPALFPRFGLPEELPTDDADQAGRRRRSTLR